ncbi:MAG: lamin tail domain-containing protein, partial [Chlamydiia bacterium]|nr:lamin tail domain-containing protein [Chlamydiia bacterium]
ETAQSIEILADNDDYHLAENWSLACPGGSPGLPPQECYQNAQLIFTEINYKSKQDFNTDDWVEVLNKSNSAIDLSHWLFRDGNENNRFVFPQGSIINAKEKIILAMDTSKYYDFHGDEGQIFGPMNFGLSAKEEHLSISNQFDLAITELYYTNDDPWPKDVANSGYTIELADTALDMTHGENWLKNCFLGTPLAYPNSCIHAQDIIISEVKYQSDLENESADWIELYNTSDNDIPLKNWKLIHKADTLNIDTNYLLQAYSYIALSADTNLFYQIYDTDISALYLPYFDLQKDEDLLFVFDPYENIGNYLSYNHIHNWPVFYNDTNNRTLELINSQDIYNPINWRSGCEYGTPSASFADCITDDINELSLGNYRLKSHPSPFRDYIDIEFYLIKNEPISISIFDLNS